MGRKDNFDLFTSTEYHQIAATSTNNEGKSRLIPAAVSKMCLDEESEEHRGSRHSCSSSQGYKSLELDVHQNPKDIKPMTVNNSAFEQKKKRKEDACLKSMEALGLENVSDFIVSEDISLKLTSVISVKESELSQKSQFEYAPWVNNLKDPQYEDISDDEHFRPPNEYIQYEDISDNENAEFEKMTVEGSSQLSVLNKCSLFGNENDEHVDFFPKTSPEKERLDFQQHCSGRNFAETGDSVENLLKNERRLDCLTSHSVSCSPHSFVEEDESDDESQDDWIVIPICMSGLEFEEEEEENEDGLETFVQDNCGGQQNQTDWDRSVRDCKTNFPASHPSSQLKEYETVESWLEAMGGQSLNNFEDKPSWPTPEHEDSEDVPQGMSDSHIMSDSSCETEDSCDYSSGSECNYMTASRQALEKRPTQEPPEAGDCASENGNDEDEVANVQKSQGNSSSESLNDLMAAKKHSEDQRNGQQIFNDIITIKSDSEDESDENDEGLKNAASPEMSVSSLGNLGEPECVQQKTPNHSTDIIVIEDSDTEEESDQSYQKSNRKRLFSSVSVKGDSYPLLSPETIQREDGTAQTSFTSADLPRSQHQLTLQNAAEEMLHGACSDSSHEKITGTQLMESKGGPNHVQHKISRPRKNTKGILSSSPSDNGDNSTVVSKKSTRNEETESKKRRVSFANSAKLQEAATHAAKFSAGDKKNTGASEKNKLGLSGNIKERHWSKPKLANDGSRFSKPSIHGNVQQQGMRSRPLSSPGKEVHLSTTVGRSASNSREKFGAERGSFHARGLCQSGEATAAANLNGPTHGPFPRQPSSSFRPPFHHSFSSPSKLGHLLPSQKGSSSSSSSSSATVKNPSKMKVLKDWQSTHHPIRTERKYNRKGGKDLETINHTPNSDSGGAFKSLPDQRDKTPRQRHRSHDSKTLLLKRSRNEAVEWSKAINRNSQQTQSVFFKCLLDLF